MPGMAAQELLPNCGPIPLLQPSYRPPPSPSPLSSSKPPTAPKSTSNAPKPSTASGAPKLSTSLPRPSVYQAPKQTSITPKSTPSSSPRQLPPPAPPAWDDDEESESDNERYVTIVRSVAPCRSCPDAKCSSIRGYPKSHREKVHCSQNSYLRTRASCYLKGSDTDLSAKDR